MPDWPGTTRRILVVEDDEEDYLFAKDLLSEGGGPRPEVHWARDFHSGLAASRADTYDVCLVDYRLGGENGLDFIRELIADGHKMPVILLTGQDDRRVDETAAQVGAADYLVKGEIGAAVLERTIRFAIRSHEALQELHDSYRVTVRALAAALELRDDQTGAHAERVTELALRLTAIVDPDLCSDAQLEFGYLLHDIGKIGVPDAITLKPGPLEPDEFERMRGHVDLGKNIIAEIPYLNGLATEIVATHHERWDGSGYPHGLAGEQIPLAARIFSIVDAFDAMTNDRAYRRALPISHALAEITRCAGSQFDPALVDAFVSLVMGSQANAA